jgi:HEAT repeat protein
MPRTRVAGRLFFALILTLVASPARGQDDVTRVNALLGDLRGPDFDKANAAVEQLGKYPRYRSQIVAGLIEALRRGDWNRCGGDVRDAIARLLVELKAREAVLPLLELVKSDKSIEHECSE